MSAAVPPPEPSPRASERPPVVATLRTRVTLALVAAAVAALVVDAALTRWPLPQLLAAVARATNWPVHAPAPASGGALALTVAVVVPLAIVLATLLTRPLVRLLRALEGVVLSYRDGDFSLSIASRGGDELGRLVALHNALGAALREQRQHLVERELLLDTLVQNTPVALVLSDDGGRVAYANIAARQLLRGGRSLEGASVAELLADAPAALRDAFVAGSDSMFAAPGDDGDETFHYSRRRFRLHGREHELHLVRRMTRELSRQEVATWKRVIRVMSHELYNSLAPISSLAHTGAELARRGDGERLPAVFATIGERARHLHEFLDGYARVAKLPAPRPAAVEWQPFLAALATHTRFRVAGDLPAVPGFFDAPQIEQALINLLKNAVESGGPPDEVALAVETRGDAVAIVVADRGPGMREAVLAQALLPFYSTKREGSGLGLALAREIAEAHGGAITLANRAGGGLCVTLVLPLQAPGGQSAR